MCLLKRLVQQVFCWIRAHIFGGTLQDDEQQASDTLSDLGEPPSCHMELDTPDDTKTLPAMCPETWVLGGSEELYAHTERIESDQTMRVSDRLMPNQDDKRTGLRIAMGGCTMPGPRSKNDDYFSRCDEMHMYAVSDGIGGAPYGDVMSRVGCNASVKTYKTCSNLSASTSGLAAAFEAGNNAAVQVSEWLDNPECGATLLLAGYVGNKMSFVWVGDSVAYRLREGEEEMELITRPGRKSHQSNALDKAIGYRRNTTPEQVDCDVKAGDRFLLCTDGVWETYQKSIGLNVCIRELSDSSGNAPHIANKIANHAAEVGTDNATAVVLIVEEGGADDMDTNDIPMIPDTPIL